MCCTSSSTIMYMCIPLSGRMQHVAPLTASCRCRLSFVVVGPSIWPGRWRRREMGCSSQNSGLSISTICNSSFPPSSSFRYHTSDMPSPLQMACVLVRSTPLRSRIHPSRVLRATRGYASGSSSSRSYAVAGAATAGAMAALVSRARPGSGPSVLLIPCRPCWELATPAM